jgi:predicted amidohydrolase
MHILIDFCDNETDALNQSLTIHFNVAVVFAPSGKLIAVYRKSHITGTGPYITQPSKPDAVTFVAQFKNGPVRFGVFICYDFWFFEPMQDEMWAGTRDFVFTNEMGSTNPYYAVVDAATGWSLRNRVNVIASTSAGNAGVGLFERGTVVAMISPQPAHRFDNASGVVVGTLRGTRAINATTSTSLARPGRSRIIPRRNPRGTFPLRQHALESKKQPAPSNNAAGSVMVSNVSACFYGAKQLGWLHFPIGCDVIRAPQAGQTYKLSASYATSDGAIAAKCTATLVVAADESNKTHGRQPGTWILAAVALSLPPVVATPSSTATGGCVLVRCENPSDGCMGADLQDGWTSNLFVSSVSVSAAFSGRNVSSATRRPGSKLDIYPFVATTNAFDDAIRPFTSSFEHAPVSAKGVQFIEDATGTRSVISATSSSAPELTKRQLASAGVWTSTFDQALQPAP